MQVIAGLATIARREQSLRHSVYSLMKQVDTLYVYLNDYKQIPSWLEQLSEGGVVKPILGCEDLGDLGDSGKFRFIEKYNSTDTYYFSVDDDIVYPDRYVQYTILQSKRHSTCGIFTYHGRIFFDNELPLRWYFKAPQRACHLYHFAVDVLQDAYVHFGGTGVMCIDLSKVQIPFELFSKERNMADIFVGIHAQKLKTPIVLLSHSRLWIEPSVLIDIKDSIFGTTYNSDDPKDIINRELSGHQTHLNIFSTPI